MAPKLKDQIFGNWAQDIARGPCEWREAWIGILVGGLPPLSVLWEPVSCRLPPVPAPVAVLSFVLYHMTGLPSSHRMACLRTEGGPGLSALPFHLYGGHCSGHVSQDFLP